VFSGCRPWPRPLLATTIGGKNTDEEGHMPYCEPHRTVRDRIIDLEIMKLELRKSSHPQPPVADRRETDQPIFSASSTMIPAGPRT
jgi:hypothetical protein